MAGKMRLVARPEPLRVWRNSGFPVASIVSMAEVKECLHNHEVAGRIVIDDDIAAAIDAYYEQWGAKE